MTVGVCHLVRKANGPEPFRAFVASLRRALPRGDWRLVLVFKGFDGDGDARPYLDAVADLPAPVEAIHVSDDGYDIGAYFKAAEATDADPLLFLNSFSEIRDPRWFEIFLDAFAQPGVGLVGATGSMESVVRNHRIYARGERGLARKAVKYAMSVGLLALFPPFPNVHVRTNAFLIGRERFLATRKFPVRGRLHSLFYESGWWSLTRQIQAMGLRVVIVNRDGGGLEPGAWPDAATFRSGAQDKLLVGDNRVTEYARATDERKRMLRWLAWGDRARDRRS